jgi:uncharacterized protein YigA (DUF484 family)
MKRVAQLQKSLVRAHEAQDAKKVNRVVERIKHDFSARAIAVRQVTSNPGGNTAGVDKEM